MLIKLSSIFKIALPVWASRRGDAAIVACTLTAMSNRPTSLCRLCRNERILCKSHTLPEFLFKSMYDSVHHRFYVLSAEDDGYDHTKPKGIYEYLLCGDCELKISNWEDYASRVLTTTVSGVTAVREGTEITVKGLDYQKLKLFQLSVIWRAGVSSDKFFKNVSLGKHEELIRKMLSDSDPGDQFDYPVVMYGLEKDGNGFRVMIQPDAIRFDGRIAYRVVFGCFLWTYIISSEPMKKEWSSVFLNTDGSLFILVQPFDDYGPHKGFMEKRQALNRRVKWPLKKTGEPFSIN